MSPWRQSEYDERGRIFVQLERAEFGEVLDSTYIQDRNGQPWKITSVDGGRAYVEQVHGKLAMLLRVLFVFLRAWAWLTGAK